MAPSCTLVRGSARWPAGSEEGLLVNVRTPIYVHATDPLSQAGLMAQLRYEPQVRLVEDAGTEPASVAIVAVEALDEAALTLLRGLRQRGCQRIVLVMSELDDAQLLAAIGAGVCALVRRVDATPARLAQLAGKAASGEGALPPDMLGRLLTHVSRLQRDVLSPMGLSASGLAPREVEVLKLVAAGLDTHEIARRLSYSERTVKNVLHDITSRYQLKNRSHAVAYAMREGLI